MSRPDPIKFAYHIDLSIIIVSWNTRDLLRQCLTSVKDDIRTVEHLNVETLVVDNASTDGTVQMLRQQFPWVRLIENKENVGFARANNQAIRQSTGRYVLLLNPDTEIKIGALGTLTCFMDMYSRAGAVGARLLNPDGTLQISSYPAPTLAREFWRLFHMDKFKSYGIYDMGDWDVNLERQVDALLGACLFIRRTALDQVGALDETYFIYSEEIDFCYRLQKAGWHLYWVPQALVIHYGGQSTRQVATNMFLHLYQGKLLYFRRNSGWLTVQSYKLVLLLAALARLMLCPLAWLRRSPQRERHLTLASRYWQLVRALPGF